MKIAILTHDLGDCNAHLMPWRTVVEVAAILQLDGHQVEILSASSQGGVTASAKQISGVPVRYVDKPQSEPEKLRALLQKIDPDILYWPFAWWRSPKDAKILRGLHCRRIGYLPGARYRPVAVLRAMSGLGLRQVAPYFAQALYPNRALVSRLQRCEIDQVITMTEDTRCALICGGWPKERVRTVWPGRESRPVEDGPTPVFDEIRQKIGDGRFFLFFSPPTPIRGTETVLDAFERLRRRHSDAHLVCLFRSDANIDMTAARASFEARRGGPGLYAVWQSVTPQELAAFLAASHAVTLPFLLVPSEIPLAVIEAAGHGAPVISTGPSGTGDFIKAYGEQVRVADPRGLCAAMTRMLNDPKHHADCRQAALQRFSSCPTWDQVAHEWLKIGVQDDA